LWFQRYRWNNVNAQVLKQHSAHLVNRDRVETDLSPALGSVNGRNFSGSKQIVQPLQFHDWTPTVAFAQSPTRTLTKTIPDSGRRGHQPLGSLAILVAGLLFAAMSFAQDVVQTLTVTRPPYVGPPPVYQSFILSIPFNPPTRPAFVVILLAGGDGKIELTPTLTPSLFGLDLNSSNFLVRSRWLFAGQNFYVLTLDSATDFQTIPTGLKGLQGTPDHVADVLQVIMWARAQFGVPVWVVGTSRGTAGAFVAGTNPPPAGPDGLVFTDSLNSALDPDSLLKANLSGILVPVLFLNDAGNTCPGTLASGDAAVVKALTSSPLVAKEAVPASGLAALSDNCNGWSDHGFFGREEEAARRIALWIKAAPYI
jgi:hypothetical protein